MTKRGYCKEILRGNTSQGQCCDGSDGSYAYSTGDLTDGALFFWRALSEGVPCKLCKGMYSFLIQFSYFLVFNFILAFWSGQPYRIISRW